MDTLTICLIIFGLTIAGFASGLWSLAAVSVTSLVALSLTGCISARDAAAYFANPNVLMIGGMCVVAAGFNRTRFCKNIATAVSKRANGSLYKLTAGYVVIAVILSQLIQSTVVVFGIVAPMVIASAEAMRIKPSKVIFPVGAAAIITCSTLPVGGGATVAAELNGYLESYGYTAYTVGMMDAAKGRLPLLIVATVLCAFIAPRFCKDEPTMEPGIVGNDQKSEPLQPISEWAGILIFFGDAVALMFASKLGLANWQVTVAGALLMVFFGVLKPKEATQSVPWSMLLLIVGALGMSGGLAATGAGDLMGRAIGVLVDRVGGNPYLIGSVFFIVPYLVTHVMQNRGAMLIFQPVAIATCASIGGNPVGLMIVVQAACLSAIMTPMATAAVPYVMDYGGYTPRDMFRQSWLLGLVCYIVTVGWVMTIFPIR